VFFWHLSRLVAKTCVTRYIWQYLNEFSKPPPKKAQFKSSSPILQTAYLYGGGSSSAGSTLVESSNCEVFNTQQGIMIDNACHTPRVRMVCSAFHSIKVVSARLVPCEWAYRPVRINGTFLAPICHPGTPIASGSVAEQGWLPLPLAQRMFSVDGLHMAIRQTSLITFWLNCADLPLVSVSIRLYQSLTSEDWHCPIEMLSSSLFYRCVQCNTLITISYTMAAWLSSGMPRCSWNDRWLLNGLCKG